jgi:hypothetical protein
VPGFGLVRHRRKTFGQVPRKPSSANFALTQF